MQNLRRKSIKYTDIRTLIVDDSASMRKLVRALMNGLGAENIIEAEDGAVALKIFDAHQFDLVLTDWKMEPVDGLALAKNLRSDARLEVCNVPIILMTAFLDKNLIDNARSVGINEVMAKPISANMIRDKLQAIYGKAHDFARTENYFGYDRHRVEKAIRAEDRRKHKN